MKKLYIVATLIVLVAAVTCFGLAGAPGYADNVYIVETDGFGGFLVHSGTDSAKTYSSFSDFLADIEDGANIVFGNGSNAADIGFGSLVFDDGKNYSISGRIMGSSLDSLIKISGNGNLNFQDIELYNRYIGDAIQHTDSGTITFDGENTSVGSLFGNLIVNSGSGTIIINNGEFNSVSRNITNTGNGTISLYGGSFTNTGFTNVLYNAGGGEINLGGTAELYSNTATRTVYNLDGGTINVSGGVALKHIQLGNIVDEEGVIGGGLGRIDNYSIYNGTGSGAVNITGSPVIKGKILVHQPVNADEALGNLEAPIVVEYPNVADGTNIVLGCDDTSLFRLVSSKLRLAAIDGNLLAVEKNYDYFIGNAENEKYILTEGQTHLFTSESLTAITKYIADDIYGSGKPATIKFQNPDSSPLTLYDGDSVVLTNRLIYNLKGIGIVGTTNAAPLILVNNANAVVNINSGNYNAQGIALTAGEGTINIGGSARFYTENANGATIQVEPGATLNYSGVSFGSDVNNAVPFMLASDSGIVADSIMSLDSILTNIEGENVVVAAILTYLNGTETSKKLEIVDGLHVYEFDNADFAGLASVRVVQAQNAEKYNITYVMFAGDELADTTVEYYRGIGLSSDELEQPVRPGYTFDGWYGYYIPVLDIYGRRYESISTTQRGNLTLYAKWSLGAPEVVLDNVVFKKTYEQIVEISPQVSHVIPGEDITYNYYWEKLDEDNRAYVFVSNNPTLSLTQVADSGTYRLGVSASRGGIESLQKVINDIIVEITPCPIAIDGNLVVKDKEYDGNKEATIDYTSSSYSFEKDIFASEESKLFVDKKAGNNKEVIITFSCNDPNYTINSYTAWASITPKSVSVTNLVAKDKVYDGNTDILLTGGVLQGVVSGDQVQLEKDASADSPNAGLRNITTNLVLLGGDKDNYTLVQPQGLKANITPKTVGITWGATEFTYSGVSMAPTANADQGVNGETVAITVDGAQKDAAPFEYLAVAKTDNNNYILTNAIARFVIAPLKAEIVWGELEFIYDGNLKTVTPTIANLYAGDTGVALIVSNGYNTEVGAHTATITGINSLNYRLPTDAAALSAVYTIISNMLPTTGGIKGSVACEQGFGIGIEVLLSRKSSDNNNLLNNYLAGNMISNGTFTIGLNKSGTPNEPAGLLTITFEAKGIMLLKDPKILIIENGEVVEKALTIDGNTVSFQTTSTGDFMLVSTKSYTLYYIVLGALALVLIIIVLALILTRKYAVEFVTDGSPVDSIKARGGKSVYLMPSRKQDYIFKGWYLDAEGNKSFNTAKMPRRNLKLYAGWQQREYEGFDLAVQRAQENTPKSDN